MLKSDPMTDIKNDYNISTVEIAKLLAGAGA